MRGMGSGPGVGSESAAGVCPGVNCLAGAGQTLIADGLAGGKGKSWYIGQDLAPPRNTLMTDSLCTEKLGT